jgi:hypothetical protein
MRPAPIRARMGRWCDQHNRTECVHPCKDRSACHGAAITGTDACRMHCGKTVERARRDALTAWAAVPGDDGISPRVAVAAQLGLAWRRAELLGEELRKQVAAANGDGTPGGLIGHRYAASAVAGGVYATGEAVRALAELESAERDRVARLAEIGHRMGIEEHQLALAEAHGALVAELISAVLARLGLNPRDPEIREAVQGELMSPRYRVTPAVPLSP